MKLKYFVCVVTLGFLLCSFTAKAETSDNAADLYIKCIQRFNKPDGAVWKQMHDFATALSSSPLSPEIQTYIEEQRKNSLIADIDAATKIKNCDWKLDYSQGFAIQIPYLSDIKNLAILLRVDGLLAALQGDCETAIDRNLAIWRMGNHRAGKAAIETLVSYSIITISETGLRQTLAMCSLDADRLTTLKQKFLTESNQPNEAYRVASIKDCFLGEKQAMLSEVPKITLPMLENYVDSESLQNYKERIRSHYPADDPNKPDPAWIDASISYINNYFDAVLTAINKPYPDAITEFGRLNEKTQKDADGGDDAAIISIILMPAMEKMYNHSIRIRTQSNALLTALDIYIAAKQAGQLPKEWPNTPYVDRFSGKPFIYETTPDGFRLRCRQENIAEKKTWEQEYKFKQ